MTSTLGAPVGRPGRRRAGGRRPLAALVSQGIVAGSSLLLQLVAIREIGFAGFGAFSLLFGILITVNSIQSGWLGDSLTVLDRFDPGIRRALVQSQAVIVVGTFALTTALAVPVAGADTTTIVLFGIASVAWVLEETVRRVLIARREFWKLVVNDLSFAVGAFGIIGFTYRSGEAFTLQTLVVALAAGASLAIAVGVIQLPGNELSRGELGPSRMRDVSSFAVWRAAQVGLRPGSQAVVRIIVVNAASYEALGQLETARVLLAPVLTVINGAGVYLLPTYSAQARARRRLRPPVPLAMAAVGAAAAAYGLLALALRAPLTELLTDAADAVTPLAVIAWAAFAVGFGAGVPAGNALVARGRSRAAFTIRVVDAGVGIGAATAIAVAGPVDAVPLGLAAGTLVGAALLLRTLHSLPPSDAELPVPDPSLRAVDEPPLPRLAPVALEPMRWSPARTGTALPPPTLAPTSPATGRASPTMLRLRAVPLTAARGRDAPSTATSSPSPPRPAATTWSPARLVPHRDEGPDRWLWLLPLVLIFATEYKFRRRSIDDALGGSVDVMIMFELAIYALVGVWVVWRLAPTRPRLTPLTLAMWGYVLTTAASALYSTFPLLGMARGVQLIIIGAVMHVLATDGRLEQIRLLLHGWIVLLTLSIAAGVVYVAPTTLAQEGRFTWLFVHSVSAGSMLALSVPILIGLWFSARREEGPAHVLWPSWVYLTLFGIHVVFLLLTRTRGSIGGAAVAVALIVWVLSGHRAKPQLVLAGLVGGAAATLAFGPAIVQFLTRGESAAQIGTFNRRTEIWTLAWDAFIARPLHGLGFTSAKGVFFDETGLGGAHNALINVMIDAGLAGLAWWLGLLLGVGVAISRVGRWARHSGRPGACGSVRTDHAVLLGIFTASLVNGVTTEGLGAGVNVSAIWLFLMVAWICILRREAGPRSEPARAASAVELPDPAEAERATGRPDVVAAPASTATVSAGPPVRR